MTSQKLPEKVRPSTNAEWTFAYHYVYGSSAADAYRHAWPKKCTGKAPKTIAQAATKVLRRPTVVTEIARIRDQFLARERMTPEQHLSNLKTLRDEAKERGHTAAAIRAEELMGKVMGFYVDRLEVSHNRSEAEILEQLKALMEADPEVKAILVSRVMDALPGPQHVQIPAQIEDVAAAESQPVISDG